MDKLVYHVDPEALLSNQCLFSNFVSDPVHAHGHHNYQSLLHIKGLALKNLWTAVCTKAIYGSTESPQVRWQRYFSKSLINIMASGRQLG